VSKSFVDLDEENEYNQHQYGDGHLGGASRRHATEQIEEGNENMNGDDEGTNIEVKGKPANRNIESYAGAQKNPDSQAEIFTMEEVGAPTQQMNKSTERRFRSNMANVNYLNEKY